MFLLFRSPLYLTGPLFRSRLNTKIIVSIFFFSAWFIGDVIESDGRVHLATPVDPLLLVIPYLRSAKRPGELGQLKTNETDLKPVPRTAQCEFVKTGVR